LQGQPTRIVAWGIGWCLVTLSLFWLVNSFAHAYGVGNAENIQEGLYDEPEVILHSNSSIAVESRGVDPRLLCKTRIDSTEVPYRYINLRLLATSDDDLFLVPVTWTRRHGVVLMIKKDEARLQFMATSYAGEVCDAYRDISLRDQ